MFQVPQIKHTKTKKKRNWSDENSVYVKRIGQKAGGFKWMHAQSALYYNKWYNCWGISCIFVSAIGKAKLKNISNMKNLFLFIFFCFFLNFMCENFLIFKKLF